MRQREELARKEQAIERPAEPLGSASSKPRQKISVPSKSPDVLAQNAPLLAPRGDPARSSSVESAESQISPSKHLAQR